MHNEKVLFQKAECLIKEILFEKVECLASTYKISSLKGKLQKGQCIYKSISIRLGKFLYCLDNQQ